MRKTLIVAVAVVMLLVAAPAFSNELELGLSWTPVPGNEDLGEESIDSITGFHIAYVMLNFLYASWDAWVMPPSIITEWTGLYRPGFLNLYDAGIRIQIRPIVVYAGLGLNNVYVYRQGDVQALENNFGANLRVAAGLRFDWWGLNLSGTAVFPSFDYMIDTLKGLVAESTRQFAGQKIVDALIPSIGLTLYF